MKHHERRTSGGFPYFKLATFDPISLCFRDGKQAYDSMEQAYAAAKKPGKYRISMVHEGGRENIIGILLAKDLLKLHRAPELNLRALLRPAVFVPESKRLNELLRDFRSNRNHLAVVIDEFGNTAGLITIEDVLEEIVGEIEDEFDEQDAHSGIVTLADGTHRVAGDADVSAVNEAFGVQLPEEEFDTIGGLVADQLGRVPRRGEAVQVQGLSFSVMLTRGGAVRWFRVSRVATSAEDARAVEMGGPPTAPPA